MSRSRSKKISKFSLWLKYLFIIGGSLYVVIHFARDFIYRYDVLQEGIIRGTYYSRYLSARSNRYPVFGELGPVVQSVSAHGNSGEWVGYLEYVSYLDSDALKKEYTAYAISQKCEVKYNQTGYYTWQNIDITLFCPDRSGKLDFDSEIRLDTQHKGATEVLIVLGPDDKLGK